MSFGQLSKKVMELLGAFCFEDLFPLKSIVLDLDLDIINYITF
jgi:hypothetical protein